MAILLLFGSCSDDIQYVYICKGPHSLRYHHSANCRGLKHCSTELTKLSIEDAKRMGRNLCRYED